MRKCKNPDDELKRLEAQASLGDQKALFELKSLRRAKGLCSEHGVEQCSQCIKTLTWDEAENIEQNAKDILKDAREQGEYLTPHDALEIAANDQDYQKIIWEELCDNLTQWMEEINPRSNQWEVRGQNLGWRKLKGIKILNAETGKNLLSQILPQTDNTFTIYKYPDYDELKIKNSHHDAMDEIYLIRPFIEKETEQRNPDEELEIFWQKLQFHSDSASRLQYLELQLAKGISPDISILKEEDVLNQPILNFIKQNKKYLSFANHSFSELFKRFHHIIRNYVVVRVSEGDSFTPILSEKIKIKIIRFAWFPKTQYNNPIFKIITYGIPQGAANYLQNFEVPYSIDENNKISFPFEKCYICENLLKESNNANFLNLDEFFIPREMGLLGMLVHPPDYLSPEGSYGNGPFSEAGMHYGIAGHSIIWYTLYSRNGHINTTAVCADTPRGFKYAGLERPTSLLPEEVLRSLGNRNYPAMPNVKEYLSTISQQRHSVEPKISGFRNVYVKCKESHQFPYFLWRMPDEIFSYPLIGRALLDLNKDLTKRNNIVEGFDLTIRSLN